MHFCRHGQLLYAVVADVEIRCWDLTTEDLLSRTHDIVPRNLSRDQWTELTGSPERYRPIFSSPGFHSAVILWTRLPQCRSDRIRK